MPAYDEVPATAGAASIRELAGNAPSFHFQTKDTRWADEDEIDLSPGFRLVTAKAEGVQTDPVVAESLFEQGRRCGDATAGASIRNRTQARDEQDAYVPDAHEATTANSSAHAARFSNAHS